jgi:archaellum component FlaF (FlaF/FlaG flagellin family)
LGDIKTKKQFGDMQLHIEWRAPDVIVGEGQGRGNSGIFLQERYELQVLDSYESVTYSNGQAGSIYKQSIPLVNATRKPGEWQVYDVVFTAPVFIENGRVTSTAKITVLHNGVLVQNATSIWGPTEYKGLPVYQSHGKASLKLQDHGNPVSFRNIWMREL